MSKMSRRIVVDASVARAAGTRENPISIQSRHFLQTMLRVCHRVVVTPEINREWRSHGSGFSTRWLASMRSRRKVIEISPDRERQAALLATVLESDLGRKQRAAVEKDCLLVGAAWASDGLVASNDGRMRRLLSQLAGGSADLARIVWVDPTEPDETPTAWLEAGARSENVRRLGFTRTWRSSRGRRGSSAGTEA